MWEILLAINFLHNCYNDNKFDIMLIIKLKNLIK